MFFLLASDSGRESDLDRPAERKASPDLRSKFARILVESPESVSFAGRDVRLSPGEQREHRG